MSNSIDISRFPPPDEEVDISHLPPPDDGAMTSVPTSSQVKLLSAAESGAIKGVNGPRSFRENANELLDKVKGFGLGLESGLMPGGSRIDNPRYSPSFGEGAASRLSSGNIPESTPRNMAEIRADDQAVRKDAPLSSTAGDLVGMLLSPTNRLVAGAQAVGAAKTAAMDAGKLKAILSGLSKYVPAMAQGAAYDKASGGSGLGGAGAAALGTATGQVASRALPYVAGKLFQAPREALDWTAEKVGQIIPEDWISGAGAKATGSNYTKNIESVIDSARMGDKKQIYDEIISALDPIKNKTLGSVLANEAEKRSLFDAMISQARQHSKNPYEIHPDLLRHSIEDQVNAHPYMLHMPVEDFIEYRVLQTAETGLKHARTTMLRIDPSTMVEPAQEARELIGKLLEMVKWGKINHNLQSAAEYGKVAPRMGAFGDLIIDLGDADKLSKPYLPEIAAANPNTINLKAIEAQKMIENVKRGTKALRAIGLVGGNAGVATGHGGASLLGGTPFAADAVGRIGDFLTRKFPVEQVTTSVPRTTDRAALMELLNLANERRNDPVKMR